jgi:hypothetical protein
VKERDRDTVKSFAGVNTEDEGVIPRGEPCRPSIKLSGELYNVLTA